VEGVLLDDKRTGFQDAPAVVFKPTLWEIKATTLADEHADKKEIHHTLAKEAVDLGGGFLMREEPVLVQRYQDGSIARLTPLSEIPGVHLSGGKLEPDIPPVEAAPIPVPVPLGRRDREKLRHILATRLFRQYQNSLADRTKYNPIRDGLPKDLDLRMTNEMLAPKKHTVLVAASQGEVYEWLLKFVAKRAKLIDTKRFGGGTLADIALHIE